jgi:uncharacterized protein (TIGR02231 family)
MQTHFPKTEDLSNLLTFIDTSLAKIHQQKQAADSSTEDIDKNIKLLQKELAALQAAVKKQRSVIEILFNAKNAQKITIEAGYLTKNAYWSPVYNVSVPDNLAAVELTMFSKIRQKTGEDWKHVSLSISNVVPLSGTQLPALSSWVLDMPRPLVKKMRKPSAVVLGAAAPDAETADAGALDEGYREKPEAPAAFAAAEKRELPLAFAYDIPRPMDIESQDKDTILPLFTKKLNGDFYYYAIPQKSPLTFLVCKAKADKELLSGPLNIYFGGRYVGKTFLTEKKAGDEFHLNLGADRGIKVEKEKIADKIKETFFQTIERGTIIRDFKYKITMENLKNKTVLLEVLDHVPVSRTDKIVVKDVHVTPEPAQRNYLDQEGVMLWQFQLEPKEKQQIEVAFVVTYPKNVLPHGLYP